MPNIRETRQRAWLWSTSIIMARSFESLSHVSDAGNACLPGRAWWLADLPLFLKPEFDAGSIELGNPLVRVCPLSFGQDVED